MRGIYMKRHSYLWGLFVLGGGLLLLAHALGMGNSYGVVPILGSFLLLAFSVMSLSVHNYAVDDTVEVKER